MQADPRTIEWLEAEAAILTRHKARLAAELSLFETVAGGACGCTPGGSAGGAFGGSGGAAAAAAAGGGGCGSGCTVNLRRLRDEVASLAQRLRQYRAHVPLPVELQKLVGEVSCWSTLLKEAAGCSCWRLLRD